MVNDTTITVRGWAGMDPAVYTNRDSESGKDVKISTTIFTMGVTARNYSAKQGGYVDGVTTWYSVRCFGALARNVADTVHKGAPLLVRGRFVTRPYTDRDGNERTSQVILADSVAIDLNSMIATYHKAGATPLAPIPGEPEQYHQHGSPAQSDAGEAGADYAGEAADFESEAAQSELADDIDTEAATLADGVLAGV